MINTILPFPHFSMPFFLLLFALCNEREVPRIPRSTTLLHPCSSNGYICNYVCMCTHHNELVIEVLHISILLFLCIPGLYTPFSSPKTHTLHINNNNNDYPTPFSSSFRHSTPFTHIHPSPLCMHPSIHTQTNTTQQNSSSSANREPYGLLLLLMLFSPEGDGDSVGSNMCVCVRACVCVCRS